MGRKRMKAQKAVRIVIQAVFFLLCPEAFASAFTAAKGVFEAFSQGAVLEWTEFARILVILLVFTVVFGRFFCGYACAFGSVGDWIYQGTDALLHRMGKKRPALPPGVIRYLQCIKYIVLAGVLALCFIGMTGVINQNSPWTAFSLLRAGQLPGKEYAVACVLLFWIVLGMACVERFFCQFLCPLGAIFSLMPLLPTGQLRRETEKCIPGCQICRKNCPVSLKLGEDEIRNGECIRCGKCAAGCPRNSIASGGIPVDTGSTAAVMAQAAGLLILLLFVI